MQLIGGANPAHYGRWLEILSAIRRALLAVVALVAAAGLTAAGATVSAWAFIPAGISLVFACAVAMLVARKARAERAQEVGQLLKGHPTRAREAHAHEYGVDLEVLPEAHQEWVYIERDFEDRLVRAITDALSGAGPALVMLCGETKAGKTRAAFHALQRPELQNAWLVEPRDGASVTAILSAGALPRSWSPLVVWLDDIERYASADMKGLHSSALRDLRCDRPVVLLATEGGRGQTRYAEDSLLVDPVDRLRNLAARIDVSVTATERELARTAAAYGERFAADSERVGLGRRMVAADEIKRKLTSGQHDPTSEKCREGQAVLAAAIDWRRAGAQTPLSIEQLQALYERHLPDDLDASSALFQQGLGWARKPLPNTNISLLRKASSAKDRFEPYDLAVQVAAKEWPKVSTQAIEAMTSLASPLDCFEMGIVAYHERNLTLAEQLNTIAAQTDSEELASAAMNNLGVLLREQGLIEEAEAFYRRADERGDPEGASGLGALLYEQGRVEEAEAALRRADERGDRDGAYNLGVLLQQLRRIEEAEAAYRRGDERSDPGSAHNLGVLLEEQGRIEEAEAAYRRGDERGHGASAHNLGVLLEEQGRIEEAEAAYRRADERGHGASASNLGNLLRGQGRIEEAEAAYHRADERGDPAGASNLGALLYEQGRIEEAEAAFRRADENGDPPGASNLGALLQEQGRIEEAEAAFCRADERGHGAGASNLGALLRELGRIEEAEAAFRRADERGNIAGSHNLGLLLRELGHVGEAEAVFRRVEELGHPAGAHNLGVLLEEQGRIEEANAAFRRAAERGAPPSD
jgi:tetratricopeptide (TPR) repeat protein